MLNVTPMSPKEFTAFRLEAEQLEALRRIRERDGVSVSEQVRRAIQRWIDEKERRKPVRNRKP
jgi:hypothetical protein